MNAERDVLLALLADVPGIENRDAVADVVLEHYSLTHPGEHHGTYARWQREYKMGGVEATCEPCREAKREYSRAYGRRQRAQQRAEKQAWEQRKRRQ